MDFILTSHAEAMINERRIPIPKDGIGLRPAKGKTKPTRAINDHGSYNLKGEMKIYWSLKQQTDTCVRVAIYVCVMTDPGKYLVLTAYWLKQSTYTIPRVRCKKSKKQIMSDYATTPEIRAAILDVLKTRPSASTRHICNRLFATRKNGVIHHPGDHQIRRVYWHLKCMQKDGAIDASSTRGYWTLPQY